MGDRHAKGPERQWAVVTSRGRAGAQLSRQLQTIKHMHAVQTTAAAVISFSLIETKKVKSGTLSKNFFLKKQQDKTTKWRAPLERYNLLQTLRVKKYYDGDSRVREVKLQKSKNG